MFVAYVSFYNYNSFVLQVGVGKINWEWVKMRTENPQAY
jgi:hypothetical protein